MALFFGQPSLPVRADLTLPLLPKHERHGADALPPQAVAVAVKVSPGGTVQVPLHVYGRQGQDVRYFVRKEPQLGKVIGIREVEQEASVLVYQHTAPMMTGGDLHDRFTFAAQDRNGTSAPAEIDVTVVDDAPALASPNAVDFGQITLGGTVTRTITVGNHGGHIMEGDFLVEAPWLIKPSHYRLDRHQEARFEISLTAEADQEYRSILHYSDFPDRETVLHATVFVPIRIAPKALDLMGSGAGTVRSGAVTLSNQTDVDRTVQISGSPRLRFAREVVVPANGAGTVTFSLAPESPAGLDEAVEFRSGPALQSVQVHASAVAVAVRPPPSTPAPLPPELQVEPHGLDFGISEVGRSKTLPVHLANNTSAAVALTVDVPPPFQTDRNSLVLEPGRSGNLIVTLQPAWPGRLSATLRIHAPNKDLSLPLAAEVASRVYLTGTAARAPGQISIFPSASGYSESSGHNVTRIPNWSGIPPVGTVSVEHVSYETADISWSPPAKDQINDTLSYRIEVRRMVVEPTGAVRVVWIPLPTVEFTKASDRVRAHLMEIPAGIGVTMRVISVTPKGRESEPSGALQFFTRPRPVIFTAQRVLLAVFSLMLIGALWVRRQMSLPLRRE